MTNNELFNYTSANSSIEIFTSLIPIEWEGEGSMEHCFHCGRKVSGKGFWVNSADGDQLAPATATEEDIIAAGYYPMGGFPVGSTCAKKMGIPATHLTPMS